MARIPNDCFSAPEDMISVEQARELIGANLKTVTQAQTIPLSDACARLLAEDITSHLNIPPSDNSAVDGYAFAHDSYEAAQGIGFSNLGRSAAGTPFNGTVSGNCCVKIFTGAIMPAGFDTVAMVEDIVETEGKIHLPKGLKKGANRRKAGEDIEIGTLILKKGCVLRPQEIGHLACIGYSEVPVFSKLKVGLLSTGDELTEPGTPLKAGAIYDSNRFILSSLLKKYGCEIVDYGIVPDDLDAISKALKKAGQECDLVISSGGVSMGDEDHVKAAIEENGSLTFWRIAIKPGRPLALGQIGTTPFVGLPGNPVAALVCATQFVRPLISGLAGSHTISPPLPVFGKSAFQMAKKSGRREWLRGRYYLDADGTPTLEKYKSEGSGLISSLTWSNGLIEIPEETTNISVGTTLCFLPYSELYE
jgi:molybdopterin molybdotransferase